MPFIGAPRSGTVSSRNISAIAAAAFLFFVALSSAGNTQAATYVVTRIDDRNLVCNSGVDCSLREAVAAANASVAVADTITFAIPPASCDPMTLVCTIMLAGPEIAIQGAGGPLAIIGTGPDLLTIDGGIGPNRIFFSNTATLTIAAMKLIGGNANVTGFGGAVSIFRGTATIDTVHFTGNSVPGWVGGALHVQAGTPHFSAAAFTLLQRQ
jgi:CSLREA domain-containing protein